MTISADLIEKYLNISINGGGSYHPDQPRIAFVSDRSGIYQVYTYNSQTQEVLQVSHGDNRSTNPVYLHNGDLLYSTDFGGNERFQLMVYREDDTGDGIQFRVTSFLEAKHRFQFATDDAVYISANLLDAQRFDVFRYPLPLQEGMQEELLLKGEPFIPITPQLVNDDGTILLVSRIKSNLANDLLLLDLSQNGSRSESESMDGQDGKPLELTKQVFGDHNGRFSPVEFLDDQTLLLLSDYQRDFLSLAIFDLSTNLMNYIQEDNWDTGRTLVLDQEDEGEESEGDQVSQVLQHTCTVIYSKNIAGSDRLFQATLQLDSKPELIDIKQLALPSQYGTLSSGDARTWRRSYVSSSDNDKLLLTYSSPTEITNIYQIDLSTNTIEHLLPSIDFDGPDFLPYTDHSFSSFDGLEVPYFVVTPPSDGSFPTIFVIHGGPEGQSRAGFSNRLQLMAAQGYMIIIPNIRGSNGYGRKYLALDDIELRLDSIKDIKALADHLAEFNPKVDADRLIIYGGSYGGFAVLSSITEYPDRFAVAIDVVGISNFVTFLENTADWRRRLREVEYGFLDQHRDFLQSISPSNKIDHITTPTLIIQGDNDERVPLSESIQMYEKLQQQGIPSLLLRFDDEGHGVIKRKNQIVQYQHMFNFLEEHLP